MLIFQPPVNFCSDENIQTIFGTKLEDLLNYRIDSNSIYQTVEKVVEKIFLARRKRPKLEIVRCWLSLRFLMINKVATTHCSFLRLQIKREDISTNAVSVTKTELYTILRDVCIVPRDVCIVSNRLTCIDSNLSEMEILAQPLSLPFIIENLS
jgi:hypothetical protein